MTAASSRLYRASLAELTRLAQADLQVLWRKVKTATRGRDLLLDVLPQLVDVYGSAAATLGADWYEELREEAAVRGRFRAVVADLPDRGRMETLARWAVGPLFAAESDFATAYTKAAGGLQRIIADASRYTVAKSSVADPRARGWQRIGGGESCEFCDMLISRGAIYSEASAEFESHDHCNCAAEPVFDG